MQSISPTPHPRNPLADLLGDAIAIALSRPDVIATMRALFSPATSDRTPPIGLVAKALAAKALGVSTSTLDRLVVEGAPIHPVGSRRMFDVAELRSWLDARGQRPPSARRVRDSVDVDGILHRSGLRAVGGAR
jgi:hypothetical protein